jgi:thiosulfate reductase cytochrome b subunit
MAEEKIYFYPVIIRLWHLINAILCLILIITGISMQFSNPKYPLIRFDIAVSVHNIVAILLSVDYFLFIIGNIVTRNGRFYKIRLSGLFSNLKLQLIYYLKGIFQKKSPPFPINRERKFNPLQQFTYVLIMFFFFPIIIITGIALMYPDIFIPLQFLGASALHLTDLVHIIMGFIISIFMIVHIYLCTIGKTPFSTFKGMINGYHEVHE